jgi:hypothetical protein
MHRKTILASAAALLIAGSATFASFAQDASPAQPATAVTQTSSKDGHSSMRGHGAHHGRFGEHGGHGRMKHGQDGVIANLRGLERLYLLDGRAKELPALYNEVLAKSQNPRVRNYAYSHLARAQMRPANTDQAIATLRKSLDENLALEQKRHAAMEQMKSRWQQRANAKQAAGTSDAQ